MNVNTIDTFQQIGISNNYIETFIF